MFIETKAVTLAQDDRFSKCHAGRFIISGMQNKTNIKGITNTGGFHVPPGLPCIEEQVVS